MPQQDATLLRQKLESVIVAELQDQLTNREITGDRAIEIAKIVLESVPEDISHDTLVRVVPTLNNKAGELAGAVYKILL